MISRCGVFADVMLGQRSVGETSVERFEKRFFDALCGTSLPAWAIARVKTAGRRNVAVSRRGCPASREISSDRDRGEAAHIYSASASALTRLLAPSAGSRSGLARCLTPEAALV